MKITLIVVRVVLGLLFFAAGLAKLLGAAMLVAEFDKIGLGQGLRYVTGVIEVGSALLLIRPATATLGGGLLAAVCIGALVAQLGPLHGDPVHAVVLGALAAWVAWAYRANLALGKATG